MDRFKLQELIIGLDTEPHAPALRSHIQLCNRSQAIVCFDEEPPDALARLKDQLERLLALIDKRGDDLKEPAATSGP